MTLFVEIDNEQIDLVDAEDFHRVTEAMVEAAVELFDESHELVQAYKNALAVLDDLV